MNWWRSVVAMELRKIFAYRTDFWVTFLGHTLIQIVIARALWQSVFESQNTQVMEGFTIETLTLYYVIVAVGNRILTGENIGFISREIYEGTFSRYLIYPLSAFQYKTLTYLTYSTFYAFQLMLIYCLYRLIFVSEPLTLAHIGSLLLGCGLFLCSSLVYVFMVMCLELIALWADNIWSLVVMLRFFATFLGGGFLPLNFFPDWAQTLLALTPFPYLISLPVKSVMGLTSASEIISGLGVLAIWGSIFAATVALIWNKGQKHYTGVGV